MTASPTRLPLSAHNRRRRVAAAMHHHHSTAQEKKSSVVASASSQPLSLMHDAEQDHSLMFHGLKVTSSAPPAQPYYRHHHPHDGDYDHDDDDDVSSDCSSEKEQREPASIVRQPTSDSVAAWDVMEDLWMLKRANPVFGDGEDEEGGGDLAAFYSCMSGSPPKRQRLVWSDRLEEPVLVPSCSITSTSGNGASSIPSATESALAM